MNPKPISLNQRILLISAGGASMLLGALTLFGWAFHLPALTRIGSSFNTMAANTAFGFVVNGLALILIATGRPRGALVGTI